MSSNVAETIIGGVVLVAAAGFLWFAGQSTSFSTGSDSYPLYARFQSISGVDVGTDVRLAGVKVGTLTDVQLDLETYQAVAEVLIDQDIQIPDDADIKVASDGLLGNSYLEITAGGSSMMMQAGDEFFLTQGSVSLINLLMKFVTQDDSDAQ